MGVETDSILFYLAFVNDQIIIVQDYFDLLEFMIKQLKN